MALDIDRYAHVGSPLQRWDPRFKIAALGIFIFSAAILKTIPLACVALITALIILKLSRIPFHFLIQGVKWVSLFLVPFFIILPLTYPGEPAGYILGLAFAWEGLRMAVLIVLKALAVVLTAYAVFGSSRFDISMLALQRLKCPAVIVQMILFSYRYIFVFLSEMRRQHTAMNARGFVKKPNAYTMQVLGNFIGTLLVRSFERTERIYKAMLSKGYRGEFHTLVTFEADSKDVLKAVMVIVVTVAIVVMDWSGGFAAAEHGWF